MKNNGWINIDYSFGNNDELNKRLSTLINELCHVFRHHPDGNWKTFYKPKYARLLAAELESNPALIRKLLQLKEPVVSNITYAAIELLKKTSSND